MHTSNFATLWWLTLVGVIASTEGWLWIQSNGQQRKAGVEMGKMAPVHHHPVQQQQYSYRAEGPWQYSPYDNQPMAVAVPLAVPITAQMGMSGSSRPVPPQVQLVPCLCPITREEPTGGSQPQPQQQSYLSQPQQTQPPATPSS